VDPLQGLEGGSHTYRMQPPCALLVTRDF
jgi:hypothetical protein